MPFIKYTRNRPAGPNNPSVDRPDMTENTNSTDTIIDVDHYSFNQNLGGYHRQTTLPLSGGTPGTIPAGRVVDEGTLYTKLANSKTGDPQETNLFYTPDASSNQYQLTRTITSATSLFASSVNNYNGVGVTFTGGWTYLPGGMLMQYGFVTSGPSAGQVTFPIAFTNVPFSIQLTASTSTSSNSASINEAILPTTTTFNYRKSGGTIMYWLAIGV